nr:hypothetical protein [Tanacetum cinerariifolium]
MNPEQHQASPGRSPNEAAMKANKKLFKAIGKGKANDKGKDKQVYIPKPKNPKPTAKEHPTKDDTCYHYKEVGHYKRNCPVYLTELLKKKKQVDTASSSSIFTIELFTFPNKSWVYDTGVDDSSVSHHPGGRNVYIRIKVCTSGIELNSITTGMLPKSDDVDDRIPPNRNIVTNSRVTPSWREIISLTFSEAGILHVNWTKHKHNLDSTNLWHCRLAHISKKRVEKLQQERLLKSTDDESFDQCVSCLSGKMTKKSFPHRPERATDLLGIIHIDACGPLRHVLRQVENQLGKTIKALRSDPGGEYISQEFKDLLKACEIVQQLTPSYTPQHNGVSEKRNCTLLDMVQSMMNLTTLSLSFWDYALESTTRILNMVPNKKVDKTPYELWYGKVPSLSYLKDTQRKRWVTIFTSHPKKNLITQEVSGRAIYLEEIQDEDTSPSEITREIPIEVKGFEPPQEEKIPIRRSERSRRVPNRLCLNVEAKEHSLGDLNEPTSYKAAMLDPSSNKWLDVMNAKMQSMIDNMVWVLVDLPLNCKIVGSKWIFKKRTDMDGFVHTYKARLVSKGYTQLYGVDYEETFSPVADIRAIRILISITVFYNYEIWKMDVKTAFLNGYLDEDIYMVQPEGFVDPKHPRKGNHIPSLQSVKDSLGKCFAMKDLREATFILGIKIYKDRSKRLIGLGQNAYMDKILKRYRMDNSKRSHILMQERLDLNKTQGDSTPEETDRDDTKSQTRYIFILNGGAVNWKSSKQSTTAISATEAEYLAASEAAMEAVWIRKFISGLGVQKGARHYHRRYHYVRKSIELGEIKFLKDHTYDNLFDPFTKALPKGKLTQHARSMGLCLASSFM